RRFRDQAEPQRHPRAQCPVARGDGVPRHRRADLRDGREKFPTATLIEILRNLASFFFEPEVCNVDARVKPRAIVALDIADEMIEQLAHSGSTADVHVAGVTKFHWMPARLLVTGIERELQLL